MDGSQSGPLIKQQIRDLFWESTELMFMFDVMFICSLWRTSELDLHHFIFLPPVLHKVFRCSGDEDGLTAVRIIQEAQKCKQMQLYKHEIHTLTGTFPPPLSHASKIRIFIQVMLRLQPGFS